MPADRAAILFAHLKAYKDEGERRGIPEVIAELHAGQGWKALNYATWGEACDAIMGGWRLQIPREDRREIVGDLREQGMSTRAIGSALGVHHVTVQNDLKAGGESSPPAPQPVTGLDGKTYAPVTRIVDPDDDVPDDEVPEVEAHLRDFLDGSAEIRAANLRARFSKWLYALSQTHLFDPEEMAVIYPERVDSVRYIADEIAKWADTYESEATQPLRVIRGDAR